MIVDEIVIEHAMRKYFVSARIVKALFKMSFVMSCAGVFHTKWIFTLENAQSRNASR